MTDAKETQNNAISLLKKDHQKVKQAFAQYEELGPYAFVHKKNWQMKFVQNLHCIPN